MKRVYVHRMLHITKIWMENDQLVLHYGELEDWRFVKMGNQSENDLLREYDTAFDNAKLVFANFDNEKEVTCPIEMEALTQGNLVVPNWDEVCRKNKKFLRFFSKIQ